MFYRNLTAKQAEQFLLHVREREPFLLQCLANRMATSGGPVRLMDASLASLEPLWLWMIADADAGFPGIPPDSFPSTEAGPAALRDLRGVQRQRVAIAKEEVAHYLHLVLQRLDPLAKWVVLAPDHNDSPNHQVPGVECSGHPVSVLSIAARALRNVASPRDRASSTVLREYVQREALANATPPDQDNQDSVLVPLLDIDLGPFPLPVDVSSALAPITDVAPSSAPRKQPARGRWSRSPLTLTRGVTEALMEHPILWPALPPGRVARVLADKGFVDAHGTPPTATVLRSSIELGRPDEVAVVEVLAVGRLLRGLHVQAAGGGTTEDWDQLVDDLLALADDLHARLGPEDGDSPGYRTTSPR